MKIKNTILLMLVLASLTGFCQNFDKIIKAVASDRGYEDNFGYTVSISGNYAIVGAPYENEDANGQNEILDAGSAYIFEKDGAGNWSQQQKIVANDRGAADLFGSAVAISGNYAIVGAYNEDEDANGQNQLANAGSAYIFERDGAGIWSQQQKIVANDRNSSDYFGMAVSISGDYAIIGVKMDDKDANGQNQLTDAGSAYIFERDGAGTWSQQQKIVANDRNSSDYFGYAVSISGNYAIIGAPYEDEDANGQNQLADAGSAYIFERDGAGTWNQQQKIAANDRGTEDLFGSAIAISGDYAIVGAYKEDENANGQNQLADAGSAYIFERDGAGTWSQQQKIVANDRGADDRFGYAIAISGDYAIVGAPYENEDANGQNEILDAGSAYIFERDGVGIWSQQKKIVANDRGADDHFGSAIAISGNHAIVGASGEDEDANGQNTIQNTGSAYIFSCAATASSYSVTECISYTVPSGDETYNTVGTYPVTDTIPNSCGADSVMTITVTILSPLTGNVTNTICNEDSIIVNGVTYNADKPTGIEVFTNVGPYNCDSTVSVNLTVLPALTGVHNETVCDGGSIVVNGTTYDATNPTGVTVFKNVGPYNCDSTVSVNLTVLPDLTGSVTNTICNEDSIIVNGVTYNADKPTGIEVFTNVGPYNCDSTVTVNLTVLPALTGIHNETVCDGGSIVVNGTTYDATNPTGVTVFKNVGPYNCDSTVTVNLTVLPDLTGSVTNTICNEDSIIVNGVTYNADKPTGVTVFKNVGPYNCDSTVSVNLTVLPDLTGSVTNTICNEDSIIVNGVTYNADKPTGIEVFTNVGPYNCDSTVTVNLTILPALTGVHNETVCDGGSIVVNGTTYDATNPTGVTVFKNVGPNNCDSTVSVNLTVLPDLTGSVTNTICNEDSIIVNGVTYNADKPTGIEVFTNVGPYNCDSTVTVNLTILPALTGVHNETVCDGGSIVVNGTTYDATNPTGVTVFKNVGPNNCDSTVSVNLTVLPALTGIHNETVCDGGSIVVNGTTYDATNPTGVTVFKNVGPYNCDSTVSVNLTVLPDLTGIHNETVCDGGSIVVNGTTYDATNPTGVTVFKNVGPYNCDSTVTVNLTVESAIDVTITNTSPTLTANQTGATYQWVDCDNANAPIPTETGQSFTATVNGNYAVEITVGSCTETSACENVTGVGIKETIQNTVAIYPNPTTGIFTINLGNNANTINYSISSIEGRIIEQGRTSQNIITINLSDESKGIYFLRLNNENTNKVYKIMKQ